MTDDNFWEKLFNDYNLTMIAPKYEEKAPELTKDEEHKCDYLTINGWSRLTYGSGEKYRFRHFYYDSPTYGPSYSIDSAFNIQQILNSSEFIDKVEFLRVVETIKLKLEKINIQIEREYKTGDDSLVLRLGKFSLDIFPDGVIVLIERGRETLYSEFTFGELDELLNKLK